jgi:hypothetical protein
MIDVPDNFQEGEKLTRIIFSPFHVDSKNNLKPEAFRPPPAIDEVSVNRINYTDAHFCKHLGKSMETESKKFRGLATIMHSIVIRNGAFAKVSKIKQNPYHADIFYGIILVKGESVPAELNLIFKNLSKAAKFFPDQNPDKLLWLSEDITNI